MVMWWYVDVLVQYRIGSALYFERGNEKNIKKKFLKNIASYD